jgi:crotonobetainyl-CoA:carnitine CoA-transferase CaiB-like acyl-CoA transferase
MGGGLNAAMGILAALYSVRAGGPARHVDIAMMDGVMAHAVMPMTAINTHGASRPTGQDMLSGELPCYGVYPTQDGRWLAVGALEEKFWHGFCDVLGREDLKAWRRDAPAAETARARAEVAAEIAAATLDEWRERLAGTDCCVSPILTLDEALDTDLVQARGMAVTTIHPAYGPMTLLACPVKMTGFDFEVRHHAPLPGEHSEAILAEAGYSVEDCAKLKAEGVL